MRVLSIDPSGTGTSGMVFMEGEQTKFASFQSKDWKEHLAFLVEQVKTLQPQTILYEHTHYINLRGKDMTSLFKLFGGIESLVYFGIKEIKAVPVNQVKTLKDKLFKGTQQIPGLEFAKGRGKGWSLNQQKLNLHELDAWLVYWLGRGNDNPPTSFPQKRREDD